MDKLYNYAFELKQTHKEDTCASTNVKNTYKLQKTSKNIFGMYTIINKDSLLTPKPSHPFRKLI